MHLGLSNVCQLSTQHTVARSEVGPPSLAGGLSSCYAANWPPHKSFQPCTRPIYPCKEGWGKGLEDKKGVGLCSLMSSGRAVRGGCWCQICVDVKYAGEEPSGSSSSSRRGGIIRPPRLSPLCWAAAAPQQQQQQQWGAYSWAPPAPRLTWQAEQNRDLKEERAEWKGEEKEEFLASQKSQRCILLTLAGLGSCRAPTWDHLA